MVGDGIAWGPAIPASEALALLASSRAAAQVQGEEVLRELVSRQESKRLRDLERRQVALDARRRATSRIGLENVRRHRERLLEDEAAVLQRDGLAPVPILPILEPVALVRVEPREKNP